MRLRFKRRRVSKEKAKKVRRSRSFRAEKIYQIAEKLNKNTFKISLPTQFALNANYENSVISLNELRDITEKSKYKLHLDFSEIDRIGSTASLALASEIYRWRKQTTQPLVSLPNLWNPEVKKALYEMGLFDLLNISYDGVTQIQSERTFVKFVFGNTTDGTTAKALRTTLEGIAKINIDSKSAFDGITEAMNNIIKHAYPETSRNKSIFGVTHPWWIGGSYNLKSSVLIITICDHGVGIPKTLPRTQSREKIRKIFSYLKLVQHDDASMIRAALEVGRSATGKTYQGKGLQDIKRFVDKYDNSTLKILSLRGEYLYLREDSKIKERLVTHKSPIRGTIVEWRIKLA